MPQSFTLKLTRRQMVLIRDAVLDWYMLESDERMSNDLADMVVRLVDMLRGEDAKGSEEVYKQAV